MAQEHGPFIVLSPQPEFFPRGGVLAPRLDTLRGKTIAFLDNNKLQPHNRYFDLLGHLLQEREGAKDIIHAQGIHLRRDIIWHQPLSAMA